MASAAHPTQGGKRAQRFSTPPPSLPRTLGWASAHPPATESLARMDSFGHPPYAGWKTRAALVHTAPSPPRTPRGGFSPPTGYRVACPRGWLRPSTLHRVENARSAFPHRPPPEPPRNRRVGFSPPTGYRVACPRGWLRPSTLRRVENARSAFPRHPQNRPEIVGWASAHQRANNPGPPSLGNRPQRGSMICSSASGCGAP